MKITVQQNTGNFLFWHHLYNIYKNTVISHKDKWFKTTGVLPAWGNWLEMMKPPTWYFVYKQTLYYVAIFKLQSSILEDFQKMGFPDIELQREHFKWTKDEISQILIHVGKTFRFCSLVSRYTQICINHSGIIQENEYTELKKNCEINFICTNFIIFLLN